MGNDTLDGGANNDFLFDTAGNNQLFGGAGKDSLDRRHRQRHPRWRHRERHAERRRRQRHPDRRRRQGRAEWRRRLRHAPAMPICSPALPSISTNTANSTGDANGDSYVECRGRRRHAGQRHHRLATPTTAPDVGGKSTTRSTASRATTSSTAARATTTLDGGDGNDTVRRRRQRHILGGEGDDDLYGGAGDDTIDRGIGQQRHLWRCRQGQDHRDGGANNDVSFELSAAGLTLDLFNAAASTGFAPATAMSDRPVPRLELCRQDVRHRR